MFIMRDKHNADSSFLLHKIRLKSMISDYAEIWADVLNNRNLTVHLEKVHSYIAYLRMLIQVYHAYDITLLIRMKNDLINLREIILFKITSYN